MNSNISKKRLLLTDIALIALFTALNAVCAWINIPFIVPFTMQTFAIFATVGTLGLRRGLISVIIYILIGILGVPVFAGFKGGIGAILGTTGGYLVGFIFSVIVTGILIRCFGDKKIVMFFSMLAGLIVCYAFGTAWFIYFYSQTKEAIGLWSSLLMCVFPFIIPDILKILLAIYVSSHVKRHANRFLTK